MHCKVNIKFHTKSSWSSTCLKPFKNARALRMHASNNPPHGGGGAFFFFFSNSQNCRLFKFLPSQRFYFVPGSQGKSTMVKGSTVTLYRSITLYRSTHSPYCCWSIISAPRCSIRDTVLQEIGRSAQKQPTNLPFLGKGLAALKMKSFF